jgi:hypothetical protein
LPHDEAERLNKIVVERKRLLRLGGTITSPSPATKQVTKSKKKKVAKVLNEDVCTDPDMIISSGGEGIGTATL